MKHFTKVRIWLFLIVILNYGNSPINGKDTGEIVGKILLKVGSQFFPFLQTAVTIWEGCDELNDAMNSKPDIDLHQQMALLTKAVQQISSNMKIYYEDLSDSIKEQGLKQELTPKLRMLYDSISEIEIEYNILANSVDIFHDYEYADIKDSINSILNNGMAVKLEYMIHDLTEWRDTNTNITKLILHPGLKNSQMCSRKSSIQQIIFNHYQQVHNALFKGLWSIVFAYHEDINKTKLQKKHGILLALTNHFKYMENINDLFREQAKQASRDMWMCDPDDVKEGTTYERFGKAFQKYLFHMRNAQPLDSFLPNSTCSGSCENIPEPLYHLSLINQYKELKWLPGPRFSLYDSWKEYPYTIDKRYILNAYKDQDEYDKSWYHERAIIYNSYLSEEDMYNLGPRVSKEHLYSTDKEKIGLSNWRGFTMPGGSNYKHCYGGTLKNCKAIKHEELTVCLAPKNAIERYAYIKSKDNTLNYGTESCRYEPESTILQKEDYVEFWNPWTKFRGLTDSCSFCMCTCDFGLQEKGVDWKSLPGYDTDRYIDLNPVVADEGYVITGVKITKVKETRTFHLQIKQAKLLSEGLMSNHHWKNITTYYPLEPANHQYRVNETKYKNGVDYHKVSYNNTVILLDKPVKKFDNQVVTGVSFKIHTQKKDDRIHLKLISRLSHFDFASGNITVTDQWTSKDKKTRESRKRVEMEDLNKPTKFNGKNKMITDDFAYVELVNSGLEADVGQNILPYIDIQPVETNPSVPLADVGLYHRGFKDSGGYLGLKATIIDMVAYFPDNKRIIKRREELLELHQSSPIKETSEPI